MPDASIWFEKGGGYWVLQVQQSLPVEQTEARSTELTVYAYYLGIFI